MTTASDDELSAVGPADLGALYARHRDRVIAYLRGQGARDPEDLASEVFLGVIRGLHGFEGDERAFRSWLLVIAHRRLVDQRRAASRRPVEPTEPGRLVEIDDLLHQRDDRTDDVEAEALGRLGTRRLLDALDAITAEQRQVVVLHAVEDLPLPRIAQLLGKHLAAVKSLHHRGLSSARRAMGHHDDWAPTAAT